MKVKATVEETSNINDSTSSSITIILGKGLGRRRRRRGPGSDDVSRDRPEEDDNTDDNNDAMDGHILRLFVLAPVLALRKVAASARCLWARARRISSRMDD